MDIFDDLIGGADEGPLGSAATSAATGASVLIVGEKAPSGQSLHVEERVFLKTVSIPQVAFEAEDPDSGTIVFENEIEFRQAMDSMAPVSVDAALAWSAERVGAVFEVHRPEMEAAYLGAIETAGEARKAPGADAAPVIWKRPPHSTGRDRGQRK